MAKHYFFSAQRASTLSSFGENAVACPAVAEARASQAIAFPLCNCMDTAWEVLGNSCQENNILNYGFKRTAFG
jgi:hypothetical protein